MSNTLPSNLRGREGLVSNIEEGCFQMPLFPKGLFNQELQNYAERQLWYFLKLIL